jgi:hypothetical protein
MRKTVLTLLAAATIGASFAGPVIAQPMGGPPPGAYGHDHQRPGGWDIERRIHWLRDRIERGHRDGSLTRREYRRVSLELVRIHRDADNDRRMHGGRLGEGARHDLEARLDQLNEQIRWLRHNDVRRPW